MKLVIDIPEKAYDYFAHGLRYDDDVEAAIITIVDGILLPKGHGRIGDLDAVLTDIRDSIDEMTAIGIAVDGDYLWAKLNDAIDNAQIIIEADKEEQDEHS